MRDLALTPSGDLIIENGDLCFVTGLDLVVQQYRESVLVVQGEWAFDTSLGLDWFGQVLVKSPQVSSLAAQLGAILSDLDGVSRVRVLRAKKSGTTLDIAHAFLWTDQTTGESEEVAVALGVDLTDGELHLVLEPVGGV